MKIDAKELLVQIKLALQDVFEAQVIQDGENVTLAFDNGQKFMLQVVEKQKKHLLFGAFI